MSANNPASNSNSANSSTHGSSSTYPQLSKDATQIVYSWLPHSTALGASSTVALRVRNASLTGMGPRRTSYNNGMPASAPSLEDEKKYNEGELSSNNNLECRIEASLYGFGLPLQVVPISTEYSSLIPYNDNGDSNTIYSHHPDFACGKEWSTATFDTLMSLPVRWRDLTRDACLTLNVLCDGDCSDNDVNGGHINLSGDYNAETSGGIPNQCAPKVWGTTLPLFDQNGRLRSGLYKLKLHPNITADGGMSYQSKGGEVPIETFLEGGATPGISSNGNSSSHHSHFGWFDGRKLEDEDNEEDPKWKASLILHELNRLESSGPSSSASAPVATSNNMGATPPTTQQTTNPRSVLWLVDLTRE